MAETLSDAISNVVSVLSSVTSVITGSAVLMTMFAGGLFIVGAKVFRAIKRGAKS